MKGIDAISWPLERLPEAVARMCRRVGYLQRMPQLPSLSAVASEMDEVERRVQAVCDCIGVEAEPIACPYPEVDQVVRRVGPALLMLPGTPVRFVVALGGGRRIRILDPELKVRRIRAEALRDALSAGAEAAFRPSLDALLDPVGISESRRTVARRALLRDYLARVELECGWLIRPAPHAPLARWFTESGTWRYLVIILALHPLRYGLFLGAWWLIGRGALTGQLDASWMVAWALMLLTMVPASAALRWAEGRIAVSAGSVIKRRLLHGALRLEPDEVRHKGSGQLLGSVLESEALESMALSGGLSLIRALVELAGAAWVLTQGAGGWPHTALFAGWCVAVTLAQYRLYLRRSAWTDTRLQMTEDLVEQMNGHRTRVAQQPRERWHEVEDESLTRYLEESLDLDRVQIFLANPVVKSWTLAGMAGLAPAFVAGAETAPIAIAVGGVLLGQTSLKVWSASLGSLAGAAIAAGRIRALLEAARRSAPVGDPAWVGSEPDRPRAERYVADARDLRFRYRDTGPDVLRGVSLRIHPGDRLLLEGPSGGGKSTLAALLVGLREPRGGLLLLDGVDRATLGAVGWRRRVVAAPQFHENHVLTGSLAFNLLMGRNWPASAADRRLAEEVCREVGLGELLDRMPSGLNQLVGDTGWTLSHGERSRLFIARALLQDADLVVLDESFASLDPENLAVAMSAVIQRSRALVVIAHP